MSRMFDPFHQVILALLLSIGTLTLYQNLGHVSVQIMWHQSIWPLGLLLCSVFVAGMCIPAIVLLRQMVILQKELFALSKKNADMHKQWSAAIRLLDQVTVPVSLSKVIENDVLQVNTGYGVQSGQTGPKTSASVTSNRPAKEGSAAGPSAE